jgi:glycosyltransferase involved in cell wall biosynthesis
MKIGIDVRLWNQTGVGRYIRSLVSGIEIIDKDNEYVLFARSEDEEEIESVVSGQWSVVKANIPWHGLQEQLRLPAILNKENLDLMHFPYFSVPFLYYKPFVVTVHDLIINNFATGRASTLPYPVYLAKRTGYHGVLANAVYRSSKIIVPSNSVKEDLLKTYRNVSRDKINVTYEGGFENKSKTQNSKSRIDGKYLLRVGNFYPHKNVEGLLKAFKSFSYENPKVKLVLVGKKDYFYERINKKIQDLTLGSKIEFVENPGDSELINLYQNATATIVPSYSEGFSLTAVEALTCGSVVLASDIPVHREIADEAAIYFDPKNIEDMKQKMDFAVSLVSDSRKELIEQGKKLSRKFSWSKMAQQTLDVYKSCI